jgi:hypothetical protein
MFEVHGFRALALVALAAATATSAVAQRWEFGAGAGGSFYGKKTIAGSAGSVDAGFQSGFAATTFLGQSGRWVGGEIRYTYQQNGMKLTGGATTFTFGGRSQALHYDVLVYATKPEAKVRPFLAAGGGMKLYEGTGKDMAVQPLGRIAVLTRTSQWKPLVSVGGGVKFKVAEKVWMRAEVRTYLTEIPTEVITPINGKLSGWLLNFIPMFSLSWSF